MKAQIIEELLEVFIDYGYGEEEVLEILKILCGYMGGRQIYFPKSMGSEQDKTDGDMVRLLESGASAGEVAARYGVSEVTVYRAVKRRGERTREERQGALF